MSNNTPELRWLPSGNTGIYFNGKEYRWAEDGKDVRRATKEDFETMGIGGLYDTYQTKEEVNE